MDGGPPRRLLRYYEEQELITAGRGANGYRGYDEACVDRVRQIRGTARRRVADPRDQADPPLTTGAIHVSDATPETIAILEREHARMSARIECLVRNRDAISGYLAAVRG